MPELDDEAATIAPNRLKACLQNLMTMVFLLYISISYQFLMPSSAVLQLSITIALPATNILQAG